MITLEKSTIPHLLRFTVDGNIDGKQVQAVVQQVRQAAEEHGAIRLLATIGSIGKLSNVTEFFTTLKQELGLVKHIDKYAIITDKKWLQAVAALENTFLPGMDVKAFTPSQSEEALEWLQEARVDDTQHVL